MILRTALSSAAPSTRCSISEFLVELNTYFLEGVIPSEVPAHKSARWDRRAASRTPVGICGARDLHLRSYWAKLSNAISVR